MILNTKAFPLTHGQTSHTAINAAIVAAITLDTYTVATLPAASTLPKQFVYVSNGAAGAACLAFSDGAAWHQVALGAVPSAS